MATLTIRNLDEATKRLLRLRAARRGVSMEQEARVLLAKGVQSPEGEDGSGESSGRGWYQSIRRLVEPYGGFELEIPPRSKTMREPPRFE